MIDPICPVCENRSSLLSMEMTPEIIEEMVLSQPITQDTVDDDLYKKRLEICNSCNRLISKMTCAECGCFVQFRAYHKTSHCALNKW